MSSRPSERDPNDVGTPSQKDEDLQLIDPATAELLMSTNPLFDEALIEADGAAMTMNKKIDLVGSMAIALLGVGLLVYAANYPTPTVIFDAIGPMGFPVAIGIFLLVGGLAQSLRTYLFLRKYGMWGPEEGTEDEPEYPVNKWRGLYMMAGFFVYFALLPFVGYLVLTPIALAVALWAMHYRNWLWRFIVGVVFTIVTFALFNSVLGVPLPQGFLTEILLDFNLIRI